MLPILISDRLIVIAPFMSRCWTQRHRDLHGLSPPPTRGCIYLRKFVIRKGKRSRKQDKEGRTRPPRPKTKRSRSGEIKTSFNPLSTSSSFYFSSRLYLRYNITCQCLDAYLLHTYSLLLEEKKSLKIH